jgi:hypothetical protein
MKEPMNINHTALAQAARARFEAKMRGLSPRVLEMRLRALANKPVGTGQDEVDPLEQAFAQQALDIIKAKADAAKVQQAYEELSRTPPPGMTRPQQLAELEMLEHEQAAVIGRLENIANRPMGRAVEASIAIHKEAEREAGKAAAMRAAAEAQVAAADIDPKTVDALAKAIEAKR